WTDREVYEAGALVLAAGAWSQELLPGVELGLTTTRAPQFWFEGGDHRGLPCFAFSTAEGFRYGFPDLGSGVKVADYAPSTAIVDPLDRDPAYTEAEL